MAEIILHGALGEKFGHRHRLMVKNPNEAMCALDANFKGFRAFCLDAAQNNVPYVVKVGDYELDDLKEMAYPTGRQTIEFIPQISGSKGKGFGLIEMFVGAALIVASAWCGGAAGAAYFGAAAGTMSSVGMAMGISLALGGVSQLLSPVPKSSSSATALTSYNFNGAINTSSQNAVVPVGYGRVTVGGVIVSGGVSSDPLPTTITPYSGVTAILVPTPDLTATNPQDGNFNGWVIQGSGGSGGKGGATNAATEDPNTLQSHSYANVVLAVCEGEIGGLVNGAQSIFINGVPLMNANGTFNFAGVCVYFTNGAQSQSVLPEIGNRVTSEQAVAAQLYYAVPLIRTITDANATSARVTLEVPQLTYQDPDTGDIHGSSVGIAIDLQSAGSGFQQVITDTIQGKCTSAYDRSYTFPLTGNGPWEIRVRRTIPDPTNVNTRNEVYFKSYTEVIDTNLRYVNTSICGIMLDAAQFSSIPTISFDLNLIKTKVPSNYDTVARTYNGIWDGTFKLAATDNPAWAFYDLITTERYGLGQYVTEDMVDKWALYAIAQYCDEMIPDGAGGTRPRFTCNVYFQQQADAFKVIQDLASIFRGIAYYSNQMITARQDSPEDPIYCFSPANVVSKDKSGTPVPPFVYSGASAKAKHSAVYVTYNDPTNQYAQATEYVEDRAAIRKMGLVTTSVNAIGCTSRSEAHNIGKWLLYVEQNESEIVTFSTGVEGSGVGPGRVILISDPARAGKRIGGRVHAAATNSITIDDDFIPIGASTIASVLPDGTFQQVNITSQAGRTFTVSPAWRIPPQPESPWAITQPSLVPQQGRVISVSDNVAKDGTYTITALSHNPSKYANIEDGALLETLPIINFNAVPPAPINESLLEQLYVSGNTFKSLVTISWTAQGNTCSFVVSYKKDGGNFYDLPAQNSPSIDIRGLDPGAYVFKIIAKDALGHVSSPVVIDYTVLGDQMPPADVKGFQIIEETGDLLLKWNPNADVDLGGYEVRTGDSWDTGTILTTQFSGTTLKYTPPDAGSYYFHIRAISAGGTYSANVSTISITLVAPVTVSQFDVLQSNSTLVFSWAQNPEPDVIGYEIREGANWSASMLVVQLLATHFSLPVNNAATRTFWIKAMRPPGIYSAAAAFSTTETTPVPNMNELVASDQQALGWTGLKIRCGTVSTELVQDDNVARSEYIFGMSLGADFNCINTVGLQLGAVTYDTTTWASANFAWNSPNAGRAWIPAGDTNSVSARIQISRQTGLQSNEVDGWDLASTVSTNGVAATTSNYVTYQAGRYNNGIYVGDLTKVDWAVGVPSVFSCLFWFQPSAKVDSVFWAVTNGAAFMRVGYSAARDLFYLEDNNGNQTVVSYPFASGDYLLIGISQAIASRTLYIGNLDCTVASQTDSIAASGSFNKIQLHG